MATYILRALSPLSAYYQRPLPVPFLVQCLAKRWWDTIHTFHIVDGRWRWLPVTFTGWPALGAMGLSLTWEVL